jgi:preprotein translocase subunit YajC
MTWHVPALLLQAPAAPQGGGSALPQLLFQFGIIILIFYFLLIRPQRKQQKQLEASLFAMKKGDEVTTAGGLVGEIVHIKETVQDGKPVATMTDRVTIKSGEAKVVVERGKITRVAGPAGKE